MGVFHKSNLAILKIRHAVSCAKIYPDSLLWIVFVFVNSVVRLLLLLCVEGMSLQYLLFQEYCFLITTFPLKINPAGTGQMLLRCMLWVH